MDNYALLEETRDLVRRYEINKAEAHFEKIIEPDTIELKLEYMNIQSSIIHHKGDYIESQNITDLALDFYGSLTEDDKIRFFPQYIESLLLRSNNFDGLDKTKEFENCISIIQKLIHEKLLENPNDKLYLDNLGHIHRFLGRHHYKLRNLPESIYSCEAAREIYTKIGNKADLAIVYSYLGLIDTMQGHLDKGILNQLNSIELLNEIEYIARLGTGYNNLGEIYRIKGDLDTALAFYNKAYHLYKNENRKLALAAPLSNIGLIHFMKGEYNQAMQHFQKALLIDRINENSYEISDSLFNLVRVFIEMERYSEARKYQLELEKVNENADSKLVDLRNKIAMALVLKTSKRTISKAKAQEILTEISKDEIHDFELSYLANLALIELLLNELKDTGEEEIIEEIRYYIEIMEDQAVEKSAFSIQAESYLLHSQLALIQLEISKAEQYINRAYNISKSHGITKIEMKASDLQDELLNTISTWEKLIEEDASLSDRIKEANIEELLNVMINVKEERNLERKTIRPALFLILAEGGVKIYEKKFKEGAKLKSALISGLLTAIHGLSESAFSTHSSVQRIKHNEYTVIIKPTNQILFCFVFKGKSYTALKKLDDIVGFLQESRVIWNALIRDIPGLSESEILGMDLIIDDVMEMDPQVKV